MVATTNNGKTYHGVGEVDGIRVLPHGCPPLDAAILGAVTTQPGAIKKALEAGLTADCFRGPREQIAFAAACAVDDSGSEFERPAVWKAIYDAGLTSEIKFEDFARYGQFIDPVFEVEFLARRLLEERQRTELRYRLQALASKCEDESEDVAEILSETEQIRSIFRRANSDLAPQLDGMLGLCPADEPLDPVLIDGLLRKCETINIIASTKTGKSWLIADLALSIVTGRPWLGRFETTPAEIVYVDNELRKSTLNWRIRQVAAARGIRASEFESRLHPFALRGRLKDIFELARFFLGFPKGRVGAFFCDAKYRMDRRGGDENSNNGQAEFYNAVDSYADRMEASFGFVHHATKGNQAEKSTTDVGAGGGAQSRAVDTHLVLRPHETEGCAVMDAAVRSFPEVQPLVLRWEFPVWVPDETLDPGQLKRQKPGGERQEANDREGVREIVESLRKGDATRRKIREETGISRDRLDRLLAILKRDEQVDFIPATVSGNRSEMIHLKD